MELLQAVTCGGRDPGTLAIRARCFLLLGKLDEAFSDAKEALQGDPNLVKGELRLRGIFSFWVSSSFYLSILLKICGKVLGRIIRNLVTMILFKNYISK